jgi:hypothetical protein
LNFIEFNLHTHIFHNARRTPQEGVGEWQDGVEEAKVEAGFALKFSPGLEAELPGQLSNSK